MHVRPIALVLSLSVLALPALAAEAPAAPPADETPVSAPPIVEPPATPPSEATQVPSASDTPAAAEKPEPPVSKQRFSINIGGALNTFFMPAVQGKLGFRLPIGDDDWEMLLGYGPINTVFGGTPSNDPSPQHATLGMRWYLADDSDVQLFFGMTAGYLFQVGRRADGTEVPLTGGATFMVGPGLTVMPWRNFGGTLALDVGYPFIIRPELNLRASF